jgi:hypothetical protein
MTVGTGAAFTETDATAADEQPAVDPITVYVEFEDGEIVIEATVSPELQVKEVAPLAVSVAVSNGQILALLAVTVGLFTKVTCETTDNVQVFASVTLAVYE